MTPWAAAPRAPAHRANNDVLICILQDTLTPAERRLLLAGRHEEVRSTRAVLTTTIQQHLCQAVEELSGRRVLCAVSGFNPWEDIASETFLLESDENLMKIGDQLA